MKPKSIWIVTVATLLFLNGCGGVELGKSQDDTSESAGQQDQSGNGTDQITLPSDSEKTIYTCDANATTDRNFADSYISQHRDDTKWPESYTYSVLSVKDIETAFTLARANDPTVSGAMILPPKSVWEGYTSSEKVLYLVNKARCDRGLKPYEGADPAIENVAQNYADYLAAHPDQYAADPHEADGRTPFERMQQDAGVQVGINADFFSYGENIASFAIGTSLHSYPEVYEGEAKAVYGWLYEDKVQGYGHRKFLLANKLVENSGFSDAEGLIGVGKARRHFTDEDGNYWTQDIIVMDGFDPRSSWDNNLAHADRVPLYR